MVTGVAQDEARETMLRVAGADLHLLRGGDGEPLIVLHGEEGQHGWRRYHELLAKSFTVVAPTLPGTGASQRPLWLESVPHVAKYYLWALDELGLSDVTLVGASLGGWVAAEIATMCPGRIRRLILVSPMGIAPEHGEIDDLFMITYREFIERAVSDHSTPEYQAIWGAEPTEDALEDEVLITEMAARLGFRPYMHDPALPPLLGRIGVPALILGGTADAITPVECATTYAASLPNATVRLLEGVGHFAHLEQPDLFADAVVSFAERASEPTAQ